METRTLQFLALCDSFEKEMLDPKSERNSVADTWYYVCLELISNPAAPYKRFAEVARMYSEYLNDKP